MFKMNIDKKLIPVAGILLLCFICSMGAYFYLGGYKAIDINGHWAIAAYTLRGIDPFPLIGKDALLPEIGVVPAGFSTVPWAATLGNVFYGGWFARETAVRYIWVLHFVVVIICMIGTNSFLKKSYDAGTRWVIGLLFVSNFSVIYSLYFGNTGGIICVLLILAVFLVDGHPLLSGVLIGLAMTKPQIAAPVCLIFLLNRKILPLAIGAAEDIAAWGAMAFLTGTHPAALLKESISSGTAYDSQYLGLFSFASFLGMPKNAVLLINMIAGLTYAVLFWHYVKKKIAVYEQEWLSYAGACIASTFWIYKNGTDFAVLIFPAICFIWLIEGYELERKDYIISLAVIALLQLSRLIVCVFMKGMASETIQAHLLKGAEGALLLVSGIVLCVLWDKYAPPLPKPPRLPITKYEQMTGCRRRGEKA